MPRPPILLIALLALALAPPASALTITVDAGGNEFYQGDIDGATVFVGNIVVERMDTFAGLSLGRTNGQGTAATVTDDGIDHQVLAEIYPQAVGNGCEFTYTTDGWGSEATVPMPYDSPQGNNDKFLGVLPGQVFGADTTVEFYVMCVGPTAQGNDFEAYVPGNKVNFFWNVQGGGPTCNDDDGDGYGDPGDASCPGGAQADCDDTNAAINPGAAEDCLDGIDNDCDGNADEWDPDCQGDDDDTGDDDTADDDTGDDDTADDDTADDDTADDDTGDDDTADDDTGDDDTADDDTGDDDTGDDDTADDDTGDDDTADDDTADDDTADDDTSDDDSTGDDDTTPDGNVDVGCTCGNPGLPPEEGDAGATLSIPPAVGLALLLGIGFSIRRRF